MGLAVSAQGLFLGNVYALGMYFLTTAPIDDNNNNRNMIDRKKGTQSIVVNIYNNQRIYWANYFTHTLNNK